MSITPRETSVPSPRNRSRRATPQPGIPSISAEKPIQMLQGGAARSGIRLGALAAELGGLCEGDPALLITTVAGLDDARPGAIVRVENGRYLAAALAGPAAALLVGPNLGVVGRPCVRVERVSLAYLRCLELFDPEEAPEPAIHPTAAISPDAVLGRGCSVGPYAVIGARCRLGDEVTVHPHAVIGPDVEIGAGSVLFPGVVVYARSILGSRVRVHGGAVIGADGFGYEWTGCKHGKRVHNGRVRIGDDAEIGANTTIDRATTGETVIGPGTKIDNLVQVGHNVRMGAHCLIMGQAGIAGSAVLGNGVIECGQAAIAPHVRVGDGARIVAKSGVWGDLPGDETYSGSPARPHRQDLRTLAALERLPELVKRVRDLERRLNAGEGGEPCRSTGDP